MFRLIGRVMAALRGEAGYGAGALPLRNFGSSGRPVSSCKQSDTAAPPTSDEGAAERLRCIFARRDPAQAGSLHLMGLESLRDRLGTRWNSVAERVHMLTVRLLQGYLSPHDTWFRHGGETYVIVFAHLGPEQARLICAKVVEEVQILLLGEADTASIMVRTAVHEIGSEVMLVPTSLSQMLDHAARRLAKETVEASSALDRLSGFRPSKLEKVGPPEVRYRPVWDVKQQIVSVFMARTYHLRGGRTVVWGYDGLDDPGDAQEILALDQLLIREAVADALELHENRFRFFLSVPVHFESLAVLGRRRALVSTLQSIPVPMRSFLTFHLYGVPPGVPTGRLAEMVGTLRPYGRTIKVVVDPGTNDLPTLAAAGVKVACVLLPSGSSAERLRNDMLRFGAVAAKNRILTSVEGVDDLAMEALCEEAGINFLSGELIGDWAVVPEHAARRSLADFRR